MPAARKDDPARRRVVPERAGRSLWLAAAWTGAGTAVVGALVAIAVVAICWLPVSGTTGRVRSTIHAGLLSFLASVHGGITVDGVSSSFLPLGMIAAAGLVSWRAGTGLADVAADLDERDPARLTVAAAAQAVSFVIACLVVTPFATLGSSEVPFLGVGAGSLLLFVLTGGVAFARASGLARVYATRIPACLRSAAHGAVAATAVYLGAGALLVAGSLAVHHARVEALSAQVGGGWGGVPVLLLGVLARRTPPSRVRPTSPCRDSPLAPGRRSPRSAPRTERLLPSRCWARCRSATAPTSSSGRSPRSPCWPPVSPSPARPGGPAAGRSACATTSSPCRWPAALPQSRPGRAAVRWVTGRCTPLVPRRDGWGSR
jgi:hypothetical protein